MNQRMIVVSNRLPIAINQVGNDWRIEPASGGLVTAIEPLMSKNKGTWIGWPGCGDEAPFDDLASSFSAEHSYQLKPVPLSESEVEKYYRGFSNEALWPLFHDLLGNCNFNLDNYLTYEAVNRRFAQVTAEFSTDDDIIWFHDYQLMLSGWYLRQMHPNRTIAFFLHIPFPSPDLFRRLPWSKQLLRGLLAHDLIGFQTLRDHRNFIHCVTSLVEGVEVVTSHDKHTVLRCGEHYIKAGHFPISIDFNEFSDSAGSKEVSKAAWHLQDNYRQRQLFLGIDRLDYTKGIPERFLAFERALEKYPDMRQKASLLQVVVPSRTMVPDYIDLKRLLEQLAGRINGRFSEQGWIPLHYYYRSLDPIQLLAHYRVAEVCLVTPLRDGMNLVAKEYCASSNDNQGILILSKFAGAFDQLGKHSLQVNPYDIEKTADTIYQAFSMSDNERSRRMAQLRAQIQSNDVHRWLETFIATLGNNPETMPRRPEKHLVELNSILAT
ncbi:MAG: trehalose-6-phosphate synthase [Desulfuromonas sp.]|nr:trehalose-6-phosphate synthase [Desulfuromonas sp.]